MVKGLVCATTFTKSSGEGTPMFSRPGKATTAEYMAFKEPYHKIDEREEEASIPETVLKEQLKNDLMG